MKPKFIAIAAASIDGKIAKNKNHPSDWTSMEDKKFLHKILDACDVIIAGNNTYKAAARQLSKRNCIVFTRKVKALKAKNYKLLYCNPEKTGIRKLVKKLGYKKVAVLGGAQAYTYFLENNLLDEIYLTIEPVVFGRGLNLFSGKKFLNKKFQLESNKILNRQGSVLLYYRLGALKGLDKG